MPNCLSTAICLPPVGRLHRNTPGRESQNRSMSIHSPRSACTGSFFLELWRFNRPLIAYIHNLDDDSLLTIFSFCRPIFFERDEYGNNRSHWGGEHWWYKFAQVCRRWRYLILGSAFHLRLRLVCTRGTPVADMLAHSPPFPLVINYNHPNHDLTAEDEEGIMVALQHRDRVRRICLRMPVPSLQNLTMAIRHEFPMLEYLHIAPPVEHFTHLILPSTFEAPQLRQLSLDHFTSPIGSPLLTTAIGLVRLMLRWIYPSTYPHPNHLLQQLSLLPQLETLEIGFRTCDPNGDINMQLLHSPITTTLTLTKLRCFDFHGDTAYLEVLLPYMTIPLLETLKVHFFHQVTFSVPCLLEFMKTTENLRFSSAKFIYYHQAVGVFVYPRVGARLANFYLEVTNKDLIWQLTSMAQIFNILNPLFSAVVDLTLDYREHTLSSEWWYNQVNRIWWRELLGSFRNTKTLRVHNGLVNELSRCLRSDGEPPLEILPKLKKLVCPVGSVDGNTFAPFIRERLVAGRPVKLIEKVHPVGCFRYTFISSTGTSHITSDPVPP